MYLSFLHSINISGKDGSLRVGERGGVTLDNYCCLSLLIGVAAEREMAGKSPHQGPFMLGDEQTHPL